MLYLLCNMDCHAVWPDVMQGDLMLLHLMCHDNMVSCYAIIVCCVLCCRIK